MPIALFLVLVILVAQFGFWDTLQGALGAVGVVIVLALLLAAAAGLALAMLMRRLR